MPLLLAPGGSLKSALLALDQGADALYIGLKGRSRGGSKGELGEEELLLCLNKAREVDKGFYLAFNLIPQTQDIKFLLDQIAYYLSRGITGVILNEPSLIREVAGKFPLLNITASIGCAISNVQEALFYKDLGANTLVLGPGVGIKEIAQIKDQAGCRVEVFIYGFHEMFTLGKCWLGGYVKQVQGAECGLQNEKIQAPNSALRTPHSAIRGRGSPKRSGVCGQVCGLVKNYSTASVTTRRVTPTLAPHAFYVFHSIKPLAEAGVDVFKLGGRYFKPQSIPPLVSFYRRLLDNLAAEPAEFSWEPWEKEADKLFHPHAGELIYQ